jgi:hypothetical protein
VSANPFAIKQIIDERNAALDMVRVVETLNANLVEQFAAARTEISKMTAEIEALKAAAPAWISVTERLPLEGGGTVAVLMDDGSILTAWATYWHGASDKFAQWTHPFDVDDAQVAYWCPIPEPMAL